MRHHRIFSAILAVVVVSAIASRANHEDAPLNFPTNPAFEPIPGYLEDFQYQLTDIGTRGAEDAFHALDRDTKMTSICANRANLWSFQLDHDSMKETGKRLQSGKIFILFTEAVQDPVFNTDDKLWWFHVAPVVLADGQYKVLDGGFPGGIRGPVSVESWNSYFAKGNRCVELKGSDTDLIEAMRLERALPQTRGVCYYRITPMYYLTPLSIIWHDIDSYKPKSPANEFVNLETPFKPDHWLKGDLVGSCEQGHTRGFSLRSKKKWCEKFLHIGKWDDGLGLVSDR